MQPAGEAGKPKEQANTCLNLVMDLQRARGGTTPCPCGITLKQLQLLKSPALSRQHRVASAASPGTTSAIWDYEASAASTSSKRASTAAASTSSKRASAAAAASTSSKRASAAAAASTSSKRASASAASASTSPCELLAELRFLGIFFVKDIERAEADVRDFLLS